MEQQMQISPMSNSLVTSAKLVHYLPATGSSHL